MLSISRNNFQPNKPIFQGEVPVARNSLLRQPVIDKISFKSNRAAEFAKALVNTHGYIKASVQNITPVTILEKHPNGSTTPVKAFLAETETFSCDRHTPDNGLAVFSQEGALLGDIKRLDSRECKLNIFRDTVKILGQYLRLHNLNASYFDKYKGVGSALINAAKEESTRLGLGGQLKVCAWNYTSHPEKGSPVPFYAKMGFVSSYEPIKTRDELIAKYSSPEAINWNDYMFLLTPENLERLKKAKK